MSKTGSFLLSLAATLLLIFAMAVSYGPVPPPGPFFNPFSGFWANAETAPESGEQQINPAGVLESVDVYYDERRVPHIFAQNDRDLYFAQGYVTASDRLFQMELQTRAAGGHLSEWLGEDLVEYDRGQRRLGMVYGAEKAVEMMLAHDTIRPVIESFTEGVNAYINTLHYKDYPLEYKILNVAPSEWKPVKTSLLLKYMTQMLAGRSDDVQTSNAMARMGEGFVDEYLSKRPELQVPVIPAETEWTFDPLTTVAPDTLYRPTFTEEIQHHQPDRQNGSNNWVADGTKTAGGYPVLSNDMHLAMNAPSIWYEIQLKTPDSNVYGVALMGAPAVIVGFNEYSAWGSTNTAADVMDWYEIEFRDENRTHYRYDGEWVPVTKREEIIHIKGSESLRDTVLYTHHGPVSVTGSVTSPNSTLQRDHALRWIAHDASNELLAFYLLNRAQDADDFKEAFRYFQAPAQNMNFADTKGNIAMQTAGKLPIKWEFQGRTVGDGSDPLYDWQGFIPYEQNPASLNPEQGYLAAANQFPASPEYPYYLGESFAPYERSRRINERLKEMENITVDDFRELQTDSYSYHAKNLLPVLLRAMENKELTGRESEVLENLGQWDYVNRGEEIEPSIFYYWWRGFYSEIWDDEYESTYPMQRPPRDRTLDMILLEPGAPWFDNIHTERTETLEDLAESSFKSLFERMESRFGEMGDSWKWGYVNNTHLNHLAQIPGLGIRNLFTDGGVESVNAIRGNTGPSWRMIVELDPGEVRGYGVYPGGQSGNPGSGTYDEFVETWRTGDLFSLLFLREKPGSGEEFPLRLRIE